MLNEEVNDRYPIFPDVYKNAYHDAYLVLQHWKSFSFKRVGKIISHRRLDEGAHEQMEIRCLSIIDIDVANNQIYNMQKIVVCIMVG